LQKKSSSKPALQNETLCEAITLAGKRPGTSASQSEKKAYSEKVSNRLAPAISRFLAERGLKGARPLTSEGKPSGAERRIAGGLGDKKVDVTYTSEHAGLVLAISVKTISWADQKTKNFQKNLQNRKADLIFEVTTLHKRFPYSVVGGLLLLYQDAKTDNSSSKSRVSTFTRAHQLLKMFNNRTGTRNEDTRFEYLAIGLYKEDPVSCELYEAGEPGKVISFEDFVSRLLSVVAERNPEDFIFEGSKLYRPRELGLMTGGEDS
jgi:hypothetical protein